jgi:hypothetical protein
LAFLWHLLGNTAPLVDGADFDHRQDKVAANEPQDQQRQFSSTFAARTPGWMSCSG